MTPKTQTRRDLLASAWIGDPIIVGGKEFCLSAGKYEKLACLGNAMFNKRNPRDQTAVGAVGEIVFVGCADIPEIIEYSRLDQSQRREFIADYMLANQDEYDAAEEGVMQRIAAIEAAMVESEAAGKSLPEQDPVSSLLSLSSQFQADSTSTE